MGFGRWTTIHFGRWIALVSNWSGECEDRNGWDGLQPWGRQCDDMEFGWWTASGLGNGLFGAEWGAEIVEERLGWGGLGLGREMVSRRYFAIEGMLFIFWKMLCVHNGVYIALHTSHMDDHMDSWTPCMWEGCNTLCTHSIFFFFKSQNFKCKVLDCHPI